MQVLSPKWTTLYLCGVFACSGLLGDESRDASIRPSGSLRSAHRIDARADLLAGTGASIDLASRGFGVRSLLFFSTNGIAVKQWSLVHPLGAVGDLDAAGPYRRLLSRSGYVIDVHAHETVVSPPSRWQAGDGVDAMIGITGPLDSLALWLFYHDWDAGSVCGAYARLELADVGFGAIVAADAKSAGTANAALSGQYLAESISLFAEGRISAGRLVPPAISGTASVSFVQGGVTLDGSVWAWSRRYVTPIGMSPKRAVRADASAAFKRNGFSGKFDYSIAFDRLHDTREGYVGSTENLGLALEQVVGLLVAGCSVELTQRVEHSRPQLPGATARIFSRVEVGNHLRVETAGFGRATMFPMQRTDAGFEILMAVERGDFSVDLHGRASRAKGVSISIDAKISIPNGSVESASTLRWFESKVEVERLRMGLTGSQY